MWGGQAIRIESLVVLLFFRTRRETNSGDGRCCHGKGVVDSNRTDGAFGAARGNPAAIGTAWMLRQWPNDIARREDTFQVGLSLVNSLICLSSCFVKVSKVCS
jgi:hypothetical protein